MQINCRFVVFSEEQRDLIVLWDIYKVRGPEDIKVSRNLISRIKGFEVMGLLGHLQRQIRS